MRKGLVLFLMIWASSVAVTYCVLFPFGVRSVWWSVFIGLVWIIVLKFFAGATKRFKESGFPPEGYHPGRHARTNPAIRTKV